ncbi:substrate-binding domain-containing protein [Rhodococcus sp. T2V]|uniref:sugar ABC transporter substrate-binding protein n=1 Tax=Rhodococcus sp. T2V TaxID=3034164 RepID=UPI0023E1AD30|nr:substrate-binding domain-containing protein [Rhodococcus sp. T2V]MDF3311073.1 substrate-binding domain-containing protein [Rhodococcus sp. T2V]
MKRKLFLSLAAAATTLTLVACSSSKIAESSDSGAQAAALSDNPVVQAAQAELDKYSEVPEFVAPNDAFDVSTLRGKRIALVTTNQTTPALVSMIEAIEEAASLVGIETNLYDAKNAPSEMTSGVAQAISTKMDGVILIGVPIGLVSKQLADADAANIPVVAGSNNQPDPTAPGQGGGAGVYAVAAPDYYLNGQLAAAGAIVKTGGDAKTVIVTTDGIDPGPSVLAGIEDGLSKCSTCEVLDARHVQLEEWFNGNLAALTTSLVTKYRDANVMLPILSTMALTMTPAAQQAGEGDNLAFFTTSAPPDVAKLIDGTTIVGGVAGNSDYQTGWLALNQVMRGMLGKEPGSPVVPTRYVTRETVQSSGTSYADLYGTAYEDGFKELWGIE